MKACHRLLLWLLAVAVGYLGVVANVSATRMVWYVDPASGDIIRANPRTGATLGSFSLEDTFFGTSIDHNDVTATQGDTNIGLSIAEDGRTLLYQIGNLGPGTEIDARFNLFRLDPFTGDLLSIEDGAGNSWGPNGLSYQSDGLEDYIFYNHGNPISDIHRQTGFSGPEEIFWGPTGAPDFYISGALGGDGNGREFGVFEDQFDDFLGDFFIGEYDPFSNDPGFINTYEAPAAEIMGLGFDGMFLYATSPDGQLFTLDPDSGDVITSVTLPQKLFSDGSVATYRFDIAAIPEPATLILMLLGVVWLLSNMETAGKPVGQYYQNRK